MQARSFVAAMRSTHPEFAVPFPPNELRPKGWRAEKRKSYGIAISKETARAPLGAPHAHLQQSGSACLFAVI
jgi:hypothetical protein